MGKTKEHKKRSADLLGMSLGTAKTRLLKSLILHYADQVGDAAKCHCCGSWIDSPDDLAIDHLEPWADDPSKFWDIGNIAFRHKECEPDAWEEEDVMSLVHVTIEDRDGNPLDAYKHKGKIYVAGRKNHPYQIRLRNHFNGRVEVVCSVDGRDVINGKKGSYENRGYMIPPFEEVVIKGFRQSDEKVAQFKFTHHKNSYSERMGTPENVGVIGVAVFKEKWIAPTFTITRGSVLDSYGHHTILHTNSTGDPWPQNFQANVCSLSSQKAQQRNMSLTREAKLGTEYGKSVRSEVRSVSFVRDSETPVETFALYYDSLKNLKAAGIAHRSRKRRRGPDPFPNSPRHQQYAPPPPRK